MYKPKSDRLVIPLIIAVCSLLVLLAFAPSIRMEMHHWRYWKAVEQIRRQLGSDDAFRFVNTHLGKSPNIPIVIYGHVSSTQELGRIQEIIDPFRSKYEIEFRVSIEP